MSGIMLRQGDTLGMGGLQIMQGLCSLHLASGGVHTVCFYTHVTYTIAFLLIFTILYCYLISVQAAQLGVYYLHENTILFKLQRVQSIFAT